jgi:serine/threonine protein phosphatase PrpC
VDSLSPREATEFLIEKARSRARGGGDNLSLVIVKMEALAEQKPVARLVPTETLRS